MHSLKKYESYLVYTLLMVVAYLAWYFNITFLTVNLFIVVFVLNAFVLKRSKYNLLIVLLFPTLLTDILGTNMEDFVDLSRYYVYIAPLSILFGTMIYKVWINRKYIENKELLLGIGIYFIAMIPSYFVTINLYNSLLETILYAVGFLLFLYMHTEQGITKQDFYIGILLFGVQTVLHTVTILLVEDAYTLILYKDIAIGWCNVNNIAQFGVYAIPFSIYFALKYEKIKYFFYLLATLFTALLFITGARTTMVSLVVITVPILVYMYLNSKDTHKVRTTIIIMAIIIVVFIGLYQIEFVRAAGLRILDRGLDSSGRVDMWIGSIEHFKDAPLIGTGLLTTNEYVTNLTSYHNLLIDSITNTGIVGLIGLILFILILTKQVLFDSENIVIGIALITFFFGAMLDTVHYNPITINIFFITLAFVKQNVGYHFTLKQK